MRRIVSTTWMGMGATALLVAVFTAGCPTPGPTATLRVLNTTSKGIVAVYCTPTTSDTWGDNLIVGTINAGESLDITGFEPGEYDVLAVFDDESEVDEDLTLVADQTTTWNVLLSLPSGKHQHVPAGG